MDYLHSAGIVHGCVLWTLLRGVHRIKCSNICLLSMHDVGDCSLTPKVATKQCFLLQENN